ncbi:MAG: gamma-glutamyl-phosphate reductase, partial [Verrucomicrobia bacterium]|nr:gamma-glutamyl-phosphate reductase [Verrucomicrobiota bacterium]
MSAVRELALRAKEAARRLAVLSTDEKNALLLAMADELVARKKEILEANQKDVEAGKAAGLTGALLDRLELTEKRFSEMV